MNPDIRSLIEPFTAQEEDGSGSKTWKPRGLSVGKLIPIQRGKLPGGADATLGLLENCQRKIGTNCRRQSYFNERQHHQTPSILGDKTMKKLMLSTALIAATAFSAQAQEQFRTTEDPLQIAASDLIGKRVYASEAPLDMTEYSGAQQGWDDIGEINDVMLNRDGSVDSVLVDIGGFLGMGERQVAVGMESLKFIADSATPEDVNDYFLVLNANRALIEGAPAYERVGGAAPMATDAAAADAATAEATATVDSAAPVTAVPMDGYAPVEMSGISADNVIGSDVYGPNQSEIGEVSDIRLTADKQISDVILDVGGFLGMGQKSVALPASELTFLRKEGSDDLHIQVNYTEQQLKDLPAVE